MRFYFNPEGVTCWNPKGWPAEPKLCNLTQQDQCEDRSEFRDNRFVCKCCAKEIDYEQALSRAKAESVPVRDDESVRTAIHLHSDTLTSFREGLKIDTLYDVPDEEINKEWL